MTVPLYTPDILRLAASLPPPRPLARVDGAAEERSRTCGSSVRVEVQCDAAGRIEDLSIAVQACAFGQASAALVAQQAPGRSAEEVGLAIRDLERWMSGQAHSPGAWPGIEALAPARTKPSRHPAILLSFRAVLGAMRQRR